MYVCCMYVRFVHSDVHVVAAAAAGGVVISNSKASVNLTLTNICMLQIYMLDENTKTQTQCIYNIHIHIIWNIT